MCGIAGAIGFIDDTVQAAVRSMCIAQRHRGPDGDGLWSAVEPGGSGVVLAHRRLAIVDLSDAAAQLRDAGIKAE